MDENSAARQSEQVRQAVEQALRHVGVIGGDGPFGHLQPFLTVVETGHALRLSKWAIYDAIKSGEIKAIRIGRALRVPRTEIERLSGETQGDA